jgi:hypothetical protein
LPPQYPLPQEIPGNLVVPAGVTADLQWAHVAGNVSVEGTLSAAATTFDRNVDVNGGHFYGYNAGFVVKGNMEIQNSSDNGWIADGFWTSHYNDFPNGTEIDGNFSYINNTGSFYVQNDGASATVKGNFTYSGNALPYGGGLTVNGHSTIS